MDIDKNKLLEVYKERFEAEMKKIPTLEDFKNSDPMVKFILELGASMFSRKLDEITTDTLIREGGKASGAYEYLGVIASQKRAERDVAEEVVDEMLNHYTMLHKSVPDVGITEARTQAKVAVQLLRYEIIQKDKIKNDWEHIVQATQSMISFLQSAIKVKEGERYAGRNFQDTR